MTNHRRIFLAGIASVVVLSLALAAASPRHSGFWIALGVLIWAAGPYFGATGLGATVVRHAVLFGAIVIGVPFAISSPHHRTFWVVLAALALILAPFLGAIRCVYADTRRVLRERRDTPQSDRLG